MKRSNYRLKFRRKTVVAGVVYMIHPAVPKHEWFKRIEAHLGSYFFQDWVFFKDDKIDVEEPILGRQMFYFTFLGYRCACNLENATLITRQT